LVKNIQDINEHEFTFDTKDVTININLFGKLSLQSNYKKIIHKYSEGIYVPYNNNYISIDDVCLGPTEKKGTWIAKLKRDLYKSLNFRFILLWDEAKIDNVYYLKYIRMFENKEPMSWYGSMGYKQNHDIDSLYNMIKDIDIETILKDYNFKIQNNGNYTLLSLFSVNNYNKCVNLMNFFLYEKNNYDNDNILYSYNYIKTDNIYIFKEHIKNFDNNFFKFEIIKKVFELIKSDNKLYYDF
jgi:hypothetical protein